MISLENTVCQGVCATELAYFYDIANLGAL